MTKETDSGALRTRACTSLYGVDVAAGTATLMGSSDALLTLTHTEDVARALPVLLGNPATLRAVVTVSGWTGTVHACVRALEHGIGTPTWIYVQ
jgi:uncharacterized protein (DUF39 family)